MVLNRLAFYFSSEPFDSLLLFLIPRKGKSDEAGPFTFSLHFTTFITQFLL